ncbi:response regulator [Ruminococcaceae bacterium OttesenSCG-928-I18]|nr:response regulator [Ruminococcaceae bacterium OttesenSCG-928-I18]
MDELENCRREKEALRLIIEQKDRDIHQLNRMNKLLQGQIDRNKISYAAKENLNRALAVKRSELERYMNLLLGNCPDMILLFDRNGNIAYCTDSYLEACGLPSFGLIKGVSYHELFDTYAESQASDYLEEVFEKLFDEKRTVEYPDLIRFRNLPKARNYSVQVTPMLDDKGGAEGAMIILSDTTEILLAQKEAERANAAKSDFLATVSHEIRTPMNAIMGVSAMLKSTGLDDKQHEYLQNIQDSSHILLNLINDILDFSKIEAGRLEIAPVYFRTESLLQHLQSMFTLMFDQKKLNFACIFDSNLPVVVYGDDKRIRQVLTNILNNALKYTEKGDVTFKVYAEEEGWITFEVSDTGIGIRQEAILKLFSAFERLDTMRNRGIVGTGLGLAITHRLCELMDGSIGVESEYGVGSTFTVRLPLPAGSEADLPPEERRASIQFVAPAARVLVVDDIKINLEITAYMLDGYEIQSELAINGVQAEEMARNTAYDLILMDHMMPEMDGVEATIAIRASEGKSKEAPIIALTANAVSGAMEHFLENGFNGFLSKPIDDVALSECLLKWLPADKVQQLG